MVYLAIVAALTIVPTHLSRIRSADPNHINLVPLVASIRCFQLTSRIHRSVRAFCYRTVFGNVALFMPLGFLLPFVDARFRSLKRVLLLALCMSLTIETLQFGLRFVGNPRATDIDDVLLNTFGACLGYLIYRGLKLR